MKLPFSFDPATGITKTYHFDPNAPKEFIIETNQPTTAIVEANRAEHNDAPALGNSGKETFVKVASIPLVIWNELRRNGIARDPVALKRWLNDPDNRFFRTRAGHV